MFFKADSSLEMNFLHKCGSRKAWWWKADYICQKERKKNPLCCGGNAVDFSE